MSEEMMARALGAGSPLTAMIGGKECKVRPLGIQELTEVERDCVRRFKREYLETFSQNLDLLPEKRRETMLEEKLELVAKWDTDDLPPKHAHDPARVKLTDKLKAWLTETFQLDATTKDERFQRMAATAMDQGVLSEEEYKGMTGNSPPKLKVPYVNWWITGCYDGMISFVWMCFRQEGVTRDQVAEALRNNMALLVDLSREIERLSAPSASNG